MKYNISEFAQQMQGTLVINDVSSIIDFDDCNGFLCDYTTFLTEDHSFYVSYENYDFVDIINHTNDRVVPYPGEFPVVEAFPSDVDGFKAYNLRLSSTSFDSFKDLNNQEYEAWWGVRHKEKEERDAYQNQELISVSRGLFHFADMLHTKDDIFVMNNHSSFQCSLSLLSGFCDPVVQLHLRGYPPHTTKDRLLELLRYFTSIYGIEMHDDVADCYMNCSSAYILLLEIHNNIVNDYKLELSF